MKANKLKIMILDDEPIVCKRLKPALEKQGYEVDTFTDSTDAMEQIRHYDYDIIILDLMLPDIDGYEVLRRLRDARVGRDVLLGVALGAEDVVVEQDVAPAQPVHRELGTLGLAGLGVHEPGVVRARGGQLAVELELRSAAGVGEPASPGRFVATDARYPRPMSLAVVTGANAGIGRATALELGRYGFHLMLLGRSPRPTGAATFVPTGYEVRRASIMRPREDERPRDLAPCQRHPTRAGRTAG